MPHTPFTALNQITPGMRVVCVYGVPFSSYGRYNQTGIVIKITGSILIRWDKDYVIEEWYKAFSFAPIDQQDIERITDYRRREEHAAKFL